MQLLFVEDLLCHILRYGLVLVKEHGVIAAALRLGAQVRRISEHLGKRDVSGYHLAAADIFHAADSAAAGVHITDDVAHVFLRHGDFDSHDGLKENRRSLLHSFLEAHGTGNVECHFRGVDFVVGSVINCSVNANYRVSAQAAGLHSLFDTIADSGDVFLGNIILRRWRP